MSGPIENQASLCSATKERGDRARQKSHRVRSLSCFLSVQTITFAARSSSTWLRSIPASRKISSVCSPSFGGTRHILAGVSENRAPGFTARTPAGGRVIVNREALVLDDFRICQQRLVVVDGTAWDVGGFEHRQPFGGVLFWEQFREPAHQIAAALGAFSAIRRLRPPFGMPDRFGQSL